MATDVRCDACGTTFQAAGAGGAAGQTAQCPNCSATVNLPTEAAGGSTGGATPAAAPESASSAAGGWHVYTCDGQRFGPITKAELDRWGEEKRLTTSCQVYQDGWPTWRLAREFYPNLPAAAGATPSAAAPNVGAGAPAATSQNPYAAPMFAGGGGFSGTAAYQVPHRGGLVLTLGILSITLCGCICGIPAWIMGKADLRRMKAGEMDNSGYGLTMAGMVLGIVNCAMTAVMLVIYAIMFVVLASQQR